MIHFLTDIRIKKFVRRAYYLVSHSLAIYMATTLIKQPIKPWKLSSVANMVFYFDVYH